MFSNIPINLLSKTQLGGCTTLSCVLGRRREERGRRRSRRGRVELTFVPTRRGVCEPTVCAHTCSYTRACLLICDSHWFDVATEYISSLVGFYVDVRGVHARTAQHTLIDEQHHLSICPTVVCHCRVHLFLL